MPTQPSDIKRAFLSFLPQDRRAVLAQETSLPDRSVGTALFADLSGFTAMTRSLADGLGPKRGAEELSAYLARTYDALVREVDARRGSVIGFSGDAITCWFDEDEGGRAIDAAHAMQLAMLEVPPVVPRAGQAVSMGLKVAAVRGPVRRFVVGDPTIQRIDALAGATLDRLARCEGLANRGEVVVDASLVGAPNVVVVATRASNDGSFEGSVLEPSAAPPATSGAWPELTGSTPAWASEWVLPAVQERLRHGVDAEAADFRPATALFLAFEGIAYDHDPAAGEKLDAFVRWVQQVVSSWGGAVVQLTLGDKGAYLYASFGAPVAYEDDAARAVEAARTLRSPPMPYVEAVRIGLANGQMYAGTYGATHRRTFGVLGSKTNLAARLMSIAPPGVILCDEEVVDQARRRWRFVARPPQRLKGFDDPVAVFEPEAPITVDPRHARPLIGRGHEREVLLGALAQAEAGTPRVVVIEGEAGIGKSHVAAWLMRQAAAHGDRSILVRGPALAEAAPYAAWRAVARDLLGPVESVATDLQRRLGAADPDLVAWAPLLQELAGFAPSGQATRAELAPEVRRTYLARMLAALLRTDEASAVALVFDDAQRMDSVSWELLADVVDELAGAPARLLIAVVYRPREVPEAVGSILERVQAGAAHLLTLNELDPAALEKLIADGLDVPPAVLPADLVQSIVRQAGGNPTYAEEIVAALVEGGTVEIDRAADPPRVRAQEAAAGSDGGVPKTLHGLVLARIDRAPADERTALKIASAVGLGFALPPFLAAHPEAAAPNVPDARERLARLEERNLVLHESDDHYAFRHALVHEVAYESMLYAQRRRVHAALAAWYDEKPDMPPDELLPILAHHYARAAEGSADPTLLAQAVDRLVEAGRQYERSGAFPEATSVLRQALDLAEEAGADDARRADVLAALGTVLERTGALQEARACFDRVVDMDAPEAKKVEALAGICLVETRTGRHDEARAAGKRALAELGDVDASPLAALVRGRLGILAALDGSLEQAEKYFDDAQRYYRSEGQPRNAASWLNNLGLARILQERFVEAGPPLEQALALAREAHSQDVEAQVLTNLGLAAQRQGRLDEAAGHYAESLAYSRALRARHDVVTLVVNLGDLALARGELDEAWQAYREAAHDATALGATPKTLDALRGAAEVLHARGRSERAAALLGFVLAQAGRNVEVESEAERVCKVLEGAVDEDVLASALQEGEASTLDEVLDGLDAAAGS